MSLVAEISAAGGRAMAVQADVAHRVQVNEMATFVIHRNTYSLAISCIYTYRKVQMVFQYLSGN